VTAALSCSTRPAAASGHLLVMTQFHIGASVTAMTWKASVDNAGGGCARW
jgi:hypothetical protein